MSDKHTHTAATTAHQKKVNGYDDDDVIRYMIEATKYAHIKHKSFFFLLSVFLKMFIIIILVAQDISNVTLLLDVGLSACVDVDMCFRCFFFLHFLLSRR